MGTEKLRGIVLREQARGESNKQIVLLAQGVGRVLLSARGARRAKSKLLAATQLFCYADFVVYEGKGFYSVTQAELKNSFYGLRLDMDKFSEAMYLAELTELDQAFTEAVADGNRHMVVFGDRFPLLYFCKTYGLEYRAAFHGCAGDTEPSLATLKYLIDKVQEEGIPVVYTIELSSRKVAQAIAETTGAKVLTFQSGQTVSRQDFDAGATYLSLMRQNVAALKEGLA